jgi:hypothetical protein
VPHPVDEHGVVRLRAGDDLRRLQVGLEPLLFLEAERLEDRLARRADLALVVAVQLHQAEDALDDHHAGLDVRLLERDVHDPVDVHAGGDLDDQRRLILDGQVALRDRRLERGGLRLEDVDVRVAAQVDLARSCLAHGGLSHLDLGAGSYQLSAPSRQLPA